MNEEEESVTCMVIVLFKNGMEKEIKVTAPHSQLDQTFTSIGEIYKGRKGFITLMDNIINVAETMCISIKVLEEEVETNE